MCPNLSPGSPSRASAAPTSGRAAALLAKLSFSLIVAALASGCPDRPISRLDIDPDSVERVEIPAVVKDKLDLLFVIDNSFSMGEEQESLKTNFRRFTKLLETIEGGLPNIHIGVVTSDMGAMGGAPYAGDQNGGACIGFGDNGDLRLLPAVTQARYLESYRDPATGQRVVNYQGTLEEAFGRLAVVGTRGCNFESHLMSMKRALVGNAANTGFLRADAYLAVVIIADEDDCSVREDRASFFSQPDFLRTHSTITCFRSSTTCDGPRDPSQPGPRTNCRSNDEDSAPYHLRVKEMVSFLKELKGERNLIVAGIVGPGRDVSLSYRDNVLSVTPSCSYGAPPQLARPAIRLETFIRSFERHTVASICNEDLSGALDQVGKLVVQVFPRCFDAPPVEPHVCSVLDVVDPDGPDRTATPLPECDAAHSLKPCWFLAEDALSCAGSATKLTMRVDRGGERPPANSTVTAECVTR